MGDRPKELSQIHVDYHSRVMLMKIVSQCFHRLVTPSVSPKTIGEVVENGIIDRLQYLSSVLWPCRDPTDRFASLAFYSLLGDTPLLRETVGPPTFSYN